MKTALYLSLIVTGTMLTGCCTTSSCCVEDGCHRSVARRAPHRQKRFCEHCAHGHHNDFEEEYADGFDDGMGQVMHGHDQYHQFADASMGGSGCCGGCQQGSASGPMIPTPASGPTPSSVPPYHPHPGERGPAPAGPMDGAEEIPYPTGNGKTSYNANGPTYVSVEEFDRLPGVIVSGPRAQAPSTASAGSSVPPTSFAAPSGTQSVQQTNWVPAQR